MGPAAFPYSRRKTIQRSVSLADLIPSFIGSRRRLPASARTSEMNRKRLVIGTGLVAATTAVSACMRRHRRAMGERSVRQLGSLAACRPADCARRRDHDRHQETPALAA
jgi:hypothetical protein